MNVAAVAAARKRKEKPKGIAVANVSPNPKSLLKNKKILQNPQYHGDFCLPLQQFLYKVVIYDSANS